MSVSISWLFSKAGADEACPFPGLLPLVLFAVRQKDCPVNKPPPSRTRSQSKGSCAFSMLIYIHFAHFTHCGLHCGPSEEEKISGLHEACRSSLVVFWSSQPWASTHLGNKVLLPVSLQHATLKLCKEACWLHTPLLLKELLLQRERVEWKF